MNFELQNVVLAELLCHYSLTPMSKLEKLQVAKLVEQMVDDSFEFVDTLKAAEATCTDKLLGLISGVCKVSTLSFITERLAFVLLNAASLKVSLLEPCLRQDISKDECAEAFVQQNADIVNKALDYKLDPSGVMDPQLLVAINSLRYVPASRRDRIYQIISVALGREVPQIQLTQKLQQKIVDFIDDLLPINIDITKNIEPQVTTLVECIQSEQLIQQAAPIQLAPEDDIIIDDPNPNIIEPQVIELHTISLDELPMVEIL